jgi:hypothetical protein
MGERKHSEESRSILRAHKRAIRVKNGCTHKDKPWNAGHQADRLPDHRPYDLKIGLIDDSNPPGPIYSLLRAEQPALLNILKEATSTLQWSASIGLLGFLASTST